MRASAEVTALLFDWQGLNLFEMFSNFSCVVGINTTGTAQVSVVASEHCELQGYV